MEESVNGKLLRGKIRDGGFLLKPHWGDKILRIRGKEFDQIWGVIRD